MHETELYQVTNTCSVINIKLYRLWKSLLIKSNTHPLQAYNTLHFKSWQQRHITKFSKKADCLRPVRVIVLDIIHTRQPWLSSTVVVNRIFFNAVLQSSRRASKWSSCSVFFCFNLCHVYLLRKHFWRIIFLSYLSFLHSMTGLYLLVVGGFNPPSQNSQPPTRRPIMSRATLLSTHLVFVAY